MVLLWVKPYALKVLTEVVSPNDVYCLIKGTLWMDFDRQQFISVFKPLQPII